MDKKFSDLVKDSISKNELKKTYGGAGADQAEMMSACDHSACSTNLNNSKSLCTTGVCCHQVD